MAVNLEALFEKVEAQASLPPAPSPSLLNLMRIATVADRLGTLSRDPNAVTDSNEFFNLCIALARGIDYIVATNDTSERLEDLPAILKQVCQCKNDSRLLAAIMTLMVSNACNCGCFVAKDYEELLVITNEIESSFCIGKDFSGQNDSLSNVSTIMSRFYPWMKMGQILTFIEVKPGYGIYVKDFHIQKTVKISPNDQIRLFVARTDCMENSSCIQSPSEVNFLLNGKGVYKRTNITLDKYDGPLMPTDVTQMLAYGVNLLQVVGEFNGNYIIIVAFMSPMPNATLSVPDYVPVVTSHDSDPEIVEGPSRISLNCPISFKRIKTPVKGKACKHHQCFEFDNFVEINSRRPSWRCPHCSQSVFLSDLCIDQTIVKILKEVNEAVTHVIVSKDGSWEAVTESKDDDDQLHSTNVKDLQDTLMQETPSDVDIVNLTEDDDDIRVSNPCELQDVKSEQENNQSQNLPSSFSQVEDDIWSGLYLHCFENLANEEQHPSLNFMPSPPSAFSNIISSAHIGESQASGQNSVPVFGNMVTDNEYGRRATSRPGSMTGRAPILNQGQFHSHHFQVHSSAATSAIDQRPRGISSAIISEVIRRQQHPSRPHVPPLTTTSSPHLSSMQLPTTQMLDQRNRTRMSNQPAAGHSSSSPRFSTQRVSAALSSGYESQQLQSLMSHPTNILSSIPTLSSVQPSSNIHQARQGQVRSSGPMSWQLPSPPVLNPIRLNAQVRNNHPIGNLRGIQQQQPPQPLPPADSVSEPEWRPTGRMRGSLSGQDYSEAYRQYILRPPTTQASRPQTTPQRTPTSRPPTTPTRPQTTPTSRPQTPQVHDLSGILPPHLINPTNTRNMIAKNSQAVNLTPTNQNNSNGPSSGNS